MCTISRYVYNLQTVRIWNSDWSRNTNYCGKSPTPEVTNFPLVPKTSFQLANQTRFGTKTRFTKLVKNGFFSKAKQSKAN